MYDNEREDEMSIKSDMDAEQLEYLTGALIDIEMENLMQFRRTVDFDMLKTLVNDIQEAPEVVIIGSRASSVLVSYATYIFNKIGIRTSGFDAADTKSLDSIINIDRTALVIAFGFARFPKSTIVTSRFLKNRGYKNRIDYSGYQVAFGGAVRVRFSIEGQLLRLYGLLFFCYAFDQPDRGHHWKTGRNGHRKAVEGIR